MSEHDSPKPVCWRREWRGDDSDLGIYIHADSEDELEAGPWEPLYAAAALSSLAAERDALALAAAKWENAATLERTLKESAEARVLEVERVLRELVRQDSTNHVSRAEMDAAWQAARALLKERGDTALSVSDYSKGER